MYVSSQIHKSLTLDMQFIYFLNEMSGLRVWLQRVCNLFPVRFNFKHRILEEFQLLKCYPAVYPS